MNDANLIARAVTLSTLSATQFAECVLGRDQRTVRRWLRGEGTIPPLARAWLGHFCALGEKERALVVAILTRN